MHDPYDNEDDGYDDDYYDYDKYKWYFKFDVSQNPLFSKWINDIVNNLINPLDNSMIDHLDNILGINNSNEYVFPVSSWNPNTVNNKKFQYLGSNYDGDAIWKTKYFINDILNQKYRLHLQSNAKHFISQPLYYKSLFDVMN